MNNEPRHSMAELSLAADIPPNGTEGPPDTPRGNHNPGDAPGLIPAEKLKVLLGKSVHQFFPRNCHPDYLLTETPDMLSVSSLDPCHLTEGTGA